MTLDQTKVVPRRPGREAAAGARIAAALQHIEEAQRLLDEATQALCSVRGMVLEWRKVGTLTDHAHGAWYAVKRKADRLRHQGRLVLDQPTLHESEWLSVDGR
jgi:hypothetical protein